MTRKIRPIKDVIDRLATGTGAAKLPSHVRAIDVQGMRPSGASATQRALLRDVLPRVKYINEDVTFSYTWAPQLVKADKVNGVRPPREERPSLAAEQTGAALKGTDVSSSTEESGANKPLVRLHFDGLPSAEVPIAGKQSAATIAALLFAAAKSGSVPLEEREAYRPRPDTQQ